MPYTLTCVSRSAPLGSLRFTANFHVKLVQAFGAFGWRSTATATGPNRAWTISTHLALLIPLVEAVHHVCHVDVVGDRVSHVCRKRSHTAEVARHWRTMLWSGWNVALLLHRSLRWPEDWSAMRK
jgi:hypothetical protein